MMFWSPKKDDKNAAAAAAAADESTPLMKDDSPKKSGDDGDDGDGDGDGSLTSFRRRAMATRQSVRGSLAVQDMAEEDKESVVMQPVDALAPLAAGGVIVCTNGYKTTQLKASTVKSLPAFVPFRRKARHRSFYLWWLNQFRHWWKSSRLLVRLAGLLTLAFTAEFMDKMMRVEPYKNKRRAIKKNSYRALRIVKKLGRGGPMKDFLKAVHPFTRLMRITVGAWRWIEASKCRRGEVGVEEAMAFIGNRVSRMLARTFVDLLVLWIVMPSCAVIFKNNILPYEAWHPACLFIVLGILRACSPFAASFQGSRVGRVLTRQYFKARKHRWQPVQRVTQLNLTSDDCCEKDEISETADLARLSKVVAKALGTCQSIGVDGMKGQAEALLKEGFRQIGAGSAGYAVYECHRRVYFGDDPNSGEGNLMTILLHVTPFGPSILDVMPRYIVMEFENSVDRRANWSEYISKKIYEGPPVLEGYCYEGAFFSPHHYAALKVRYDKELVTYDYACKALCGTKRTQNPPSDLRSLKAFLTTGKRGRKRKKNAREYHQLQNSVARVTKELKSMLNASGGCCAPRGVILYFEGLDCSGKSSTGGLVEQVLRDAGYTVDMRQYNRPPTAAEKERPWMDRFAVPSVTVAVAIKNGGTDDEETNELVKKCVDHGHNALVWDRGPVGDFVYGALASASDEEKKKRYEEFIAFDKEMFDKRILFSKMLFVTNRDSIASTLGKRLAQVKMARDLKTWNQASRGGVSSQYGDIGFEGLDEIFLHIDPTDFVAFNMYQRNLRIFTNVALNTDTEENPWLVVNTGDRYAARQALLRAFSAQLQRFKTRNTCFDLCPQRGAVPTGTGEEPSTPALSQEAMMEKGFSKPWPIQLVLSLGGMLLIIFYYCEHTTFGTNFDSLVKTLVEDAEDEI